MKTIIVYDSVFGNTGEIARSIYETILSKEEVGFYNVHEARNVIMNGTKLLIVGSPTRGFRPTPEISGFIKSLSPLSLHGMKIAVFDTRLSLPDINSSFVKFIVKNGGYAATSMANYLSKTGGQLVAPPEGFLVTGEKGPLKDGELTRASVWINRILDKSSIPESAHGKLI